MTEPDPALQGFDALIGTWDIEAKHRFIDAVVAGTDTFEWLEGHHVLIQRTHYDHDLLPDAISVIGRPETGEGLVQEYFDVRGVRRTFAVSVEGGVFRTLREYPGFSQRTTATLSDETFEAVCQLAETPGEWQDDMTVTYRRRRVSA